MSSRGGCELLVSADDRTGALEVGGALAGKNHTVPVGPNADSERCCVVDLGTRHLGPEIARRRMLDLHGRTARHRCHKMDSGLRGNWPFEVAALVSLGYPIAIVPSFPDAGRRCQDGVVYINDVPVLESPIGSDPLTAPSSSRPSEILQSTGCDGGDVVVWDAIDNVELNAAMARCRDEGRVLVGPTGAIAAYAATVFPDERPVAASVPDPVLVVCGSLNAASREQVHRLHCPVYCLDDDYVKTHRLAALVTPLPSEPITHDAAAAMAATVAEWLRKAKAPVGTLFIIGGDTATAILGVDTLEVQGTVDTAVAISRHRGRYIVSKGGGIGTPDTLVNLLGTGSI